MLALVPSRFWSAVIMAPACAAFWVVAASAVAAWVATPTLRYARSGVPVTVASPTATMDEGREAPCPQDPAASASAAIASTIRFGIDLPLPPLLRRLGRPFCDRTARSSWNRAAVAPVLMPPTQTGGKSKTMFWGGTMLFRLSLSAAFFAVFALSALGQVPASAVKAATAKKAWTPPHTPDGVADLQGVWTNNTTTPLQRPKNLAG